jgi:ribosomal protein S11
MILSNILFIKSSKEKRTLFLVSYINKLSKLLKPLNKTQSPKNLASMLLNTTNDTTYLKFEQNKNSVFLKQNLFKENLVSYIININLSPTNTLVNVTDINGNPKISFSAGLVKLTKKQKKAQPMALINIFKVLLLKAKFLENKPVALHFKNTKIFYESLIIKMLKERLFIKSVHSHNLSPHNGCRPKKLKRIKRRTKRMVLR